MSSLNLDPFLEPNTILQKILQAVENIEQAVANPPRFLSGLSIAAENRLQDEKSKIEIIEGCEETIKGLRREITALKQELEGLRSLKDAQAKTAAEQLRLYDERHETDTKIIRDVMARLKKQ